MPTIREIAKAASVSPMTVSFVINDKPGQVGEETRERVLRVMRDMGYRPRVAARQSQETAVRTVGIAAGVSTASFVDGGYYGHILSSILNASEQIGLNTLLFHPSLFHEDSHKSIRAYLDGRCEGLLLVAPRSGIPLINVLRERGVPFVLIADTGDDVGVTIVDVDNVPAAKAAVSYLAGLGHRRIGFIGGAEFVHAVLQRREGYRQALAENDLPYDPAIESGFLLTNVDVYEWVVSVMRRKDIQRPTAFFCWNDAVAVRALTALRDLNIRVPEQVSLVGFDDFPEVATIFPALTTIRQPYREIGAKAVEELMQQVGTSRDAEEPARRFLLPARLIVRDSATVPPS